MSVVHLIYREKNYETQTKDYEFSRVSMDEHWQAGVNDTRRTLQHEGSGWRRPTISRPCASSTSPATSIEVVLAAS